MSDLALSVRGLTKEYQILHNAERHNRVTDAVADSVKGLFRKKEVETFRALDDVSFDVKKGEVLGVIGRNGAGKSTLLKILSRITEPTSGEIHLYGRVGSLLEVGTGFHPELTGRENIYLNGAILGMRKKEIDRQFDAIVDFAEVEKFLDTPVKRYSSGMYVRLAFAVAAHLNPEILIVDEVLAVGDAQFQKKCLGKMQEVSRQDGRTVLFVSHNMAAVKSLCTSSCLLQDGSLLKQGDTAELIALYVSKSNTANSRLGTDARQRVGTGDIVILGATIRGQESVGSGSIRSRSSFIVDIEISARIETRRLMASIDVNSLDGTRLTTMWSAFVEQSFSIEPGRYVLSCRIDRLDLRPDTYRLNVGIGDEVQTHDIVLDAIELAIEAHDPEDVYGSALLPRADHGHLLSTFTWQIAPRHTMEAIVL